MIGVALLACAGPSPGGPAAAERDSAEPELAFAFGDLHAHTGASGDGCSADQGENPNPECGSLFALAEEARENGLEFAALTDHVDGPRAWSGAEAAAAWEAVNAAAFADSADDLIFLPGAEIALTTPNDDGTTHEVGHKTLVFFGDEAELVGLTRGHATPNHGNGTDVGSCAHLWGWAEGLEAHYGPIVLFPHHPAVTTPMPTDYACTNPAFEPGVEVYGHFGNSRLPPGTPEGAADFDPLLDREGIPQAGTASGSVQYLLTEFPTAHLGFLAGTDGHHTRPGDTCRFDDVRADAQYGGGLTGAWFPAAEGLSRDTLHEALVARHTLATSGPQVAARVRVLDAEGSTVAWAGDELQAPTSATLSVEVPSPFAEEVTAAWAVSAGDAPGSEVRVAIPASGAGWWSLPLAPASGTFVYVMLELSGPESHPVGCNDGPEGDDSERVWVSPIWFR